MTTGDKDPYATDQRCLASLPDHDRVPRKRAGAERDRGSSSHRNVGQPSGANRRHQERPVRVRRTRGHAQRTGTQHRHERREIEGLNEILDATHTALVNLADAEVDYLELEQATKEQIAQGATGDMVSLDMARDKVSKSRESLTQSRSTLSYRIENLADETGSGLFTPN